MHLREIHWVTDNLEDSVNFYARTLGLKEIERESDIVALQGKDISSCLFLHQKDADMDEGQIVVCFTVENLDSIVQRLKTADVEVKLENYDDGTPVAYFSSPENVMIGLTTADLIDMSGGEETEIWINRFVLKTDDIEDSLQFYTQVLGLKEIEGWTYEDNPKDVGLQAGDIFIELLSTGWFESGGFEYIGFEVDNLYNAVQKLEDAGVDGYLADNIHEDGSRWGFFEGPDNVKIGLVGLDQAISDEKIDSQDGDAERPSIGEKVRFWEEQDKINEALIPRVMEMHEIVTDLHKRTANISGQIAAAEARVLQQMQEQVSGMVNDLMPDIEKRLIQLVKEEIKSQIDQNLSGIRRTTYVALILAALAFAITLYQWIA